MPSPEPQYSQQHLVPQGLQAAQFPLISSTDARNKRVPKAAKTPSKAAGAKAKAQREAAREAPAEATPEVQAEAVQVAARS